MQKCSIKDAQILNIYLSFYFQKKICFHDFYVISCQGVIHLVCLQNLLITKIFHGSTPGALFLEHFMDMLNDGLLTPLLSFYFAANCHYIIILIIVLLTTVVKRHSYRTMLHWFVTNCYTDCCWLRSLFLDIISLINCFTVTA